jgi:hypothetical protein
MSAKSRSASASPRWLLAAAITTVLAAASPAEADPCDLRLARDPVPVRIDYDPFAFSRPPGRLDLDLVNDGDGRCDLELRLLDLDGQPLHSLRLDQVALEVRLREGGVAGATRLDPNRFSLSVPAGAPTTVAFDLMVLSDAVAEAGEHHAAFRAEIGPAGGVPVVLIGPIDVVLASPPRAQLNIAGAAGAFGSTSSVEVIDFGEARPGAVKRAFLQIRANTSSRLTFRSEHGGSLRRLGAAEDEAGIDYRVTLDGELLDLRQQAVRRVDPPRTVQGQSLPLDFELGATSSRRSGYYEDLLMVDIDPN